MIRIALDAMGGDYAPKEVLLGAKFSLRKNPLHIALIGHKDLLLQEMKALRMSENERLQIEHAPEKIDMGESPTSAFRTKKQSSIHVGLTLVKEKKASAFVSAGNTGAVMAASTFILGRTPHVERPAIATILPTQKRPLVMLDMGSNVDCKPIYLAQFAVMGKYFSEYALNTQNPRIGLLNIGEEPDKGNALSQNTYLLLKQSSLNFIGNIEGRDLLTGDVDVVVCDGFVGNAVLKFGEGVAELIMNFFKTEAKASWLSAAGLVLLTPSFKRFKKRFDYQETGGAPLLGVNGVSIIAHGKSKAIAIQNAIQTAINAVNSQIVEKLTKVFSQ